MLMYIIGSLPTRNQILFHSCVHALAVQFMELFFFFFGGGGVGGRRKKNISYLVPGLGIYKYDYVKSVSGSLFVLSCRVFCAH